MVRSLVRQEMKWPIGVFFSRTLGDTCGGEERAEDIRVVMGDVACAVFVSFRAIPFFFSAYN